MCFCIGWGGRNRTHEWKSQNLLPYRLATPQCKIMIQQEKEKIKQMLGFGGGKSERNGVKFKSI